MGVFLNTFGYLSVLDKSELIYTSLGLYSALVILILILLTSFNALTTLELHA